MISTPLGQWPVNADGERALEGAVQTGDRYRFKVDGPGPEPVTFTGRVRRSHTSPTDYVLETGPGQSGSP